MNLTEPHAGSDVGALTSKAEPAGDGTWRIFGQKIFITWGEHDVADNIVHLVLARTQVRLGTKGIQPLHRPEVPRQRRRHARRAQRPHVREHRAQARHSWQSERVSCSTATTAAVGYLLGEEHQGMRCMFTMMNNARLGVGVEGVGIAERLPAGARLRP